MKLMLTGIIDEFLKEAALGVVRRGGRVVSVVGENVAPDEFPGADVVTHYDLLDTKFLDERARNAAHVLSEDVIKQFKECEEVFLSNSDRFAYFKLSVRERKVIYYNILSYWYNYFLSKNIDLIFFESTPHMGWDTVLYYAARYFGIRIAILERTSIEDHIFLADGVADSGRVPEDFGTGMTKEALIEAVGPEFYKTVFKDSYWVKRSKEINAGSAKKGKLPRAAATVWNITREIFNLSNYFRIERQSSYAYNGFVNRGLFVWLEQFRKLKIRKIARYYKSLVKPVRAEDKYIFFPLQYQPERTSIPLGGAFEYQTLAVEILSRSVPADWKIYVKEHPRQFRQPGICGIHYRDKNFYDRLKSLPSVVLVSIDEDSGRLMQNAQCVATLTGSAGWESILGGKACLVFGFPWYTSCRSALRVHSVESCKAALADAGNKRKEDVEADLLKFLLYYRRKLIRSTNMQMFADRSAETAATLADNLARAILHYGEPKTEKAAL